MSEMPVAMRGRAAPRRACSLTEGFHLLDFNRESAIGKQGIDKVQA
jgi:hypothetical protein